MPELSKTYTPGEVEQRWYQRWLDEKCFQAEPERVDARRPAYSIVIPPPNVTGILTLGHVLNNTIQDILSRRARMLGREVLWLPGTDHAGIATERQVEKMLRRDAHKSKQEIGREQFIKHVWEWKEKHGGIIIQQLKELGCSCDWSRERFTADPDYSHCVSLVFVDLYKKGLIYRGKRMVNWCPVSLTAVSDEEVEMREQKGHLYYFKVEVVEEPGTWLTIATTRPETIPGDSGIAVNPGDKRYAHLIGKHARRPLPLENQAPLPIVADEHIDIEFGTGVLKVTPAHDKADFDIGQRHNLELIDIMEPDGTMNALAGKDLDGLDRFEARKKAVELLRETGSLEKEEPYQNKVGFSERGGVPIEPRLSEQWFLRYPSVEKARTCVEGAGEDEEEAEQASPKEAATGEPKMRFHPRRWAKVYDHWMSGLQDWCISRQLWWGHRIPVWSRRISIEAAEKPTTVQQETQELLDSLLASNSRVSPAQPKVNFIEMCLSKTEGESTACNLRLLPEGDMLVEAATTSKAEIRWLESHGFTQDPDVLDTWFSSWLWPFATMGWTGDAARDAENPTLRAFYPTADLVTGPDIIFFWVARMIMAGFEYMGELPFRNVYFTGIIRDKQGRKMSKSLGNSPDPLALIEQYGADALRLGIMRSAPLGQDILFDEKNVELGRNFCTKLWNAARFRQMQGGDGEAEIRGDLLGSDDKWILLRLNAAIEEVTRSIEEYRFSDATAALYRFFWSEYCDWYLEASKAVLGGADAARKANTLAVMDFVLGHTLRLFHPFLPFISEELWHGMGFSEDMPKQQGGRSIMFAPWPKPLDADELAHFGILPEDEKAANDKYEVVNLGRGLKSAFNIASNKRVRFVLKPSAILPEHEVEVLRILLNAEPLEVNAAYTPPTGTPAALTPLGELLLPLEGLIDVAAERARLEKEMSKAGAELEKVQAKLADRNFTSKVPEKVLQEHRQREADWQAKKAKLEEMMKALG